MTPLRQRMINDMTVRGLAENTKLSYLRSVTGLVRHYRRSPDQISAPEVQDYLLFLHAQRGLSWKTCNTVRHGVRFFYRITLGVPDPHFYMPCAKEPSTLPQILNHDELVRLFTVTTNLKHRALLMTAYAAGLRASELGRLQLTDVDSARMCLRVDRGKGNKDRYVPLSPRLTGDPCYPSSTGRPAGAGGRGHLARGRRLLSGDPSALDPATTRRERAGELPYRRARWIHSALRPLRGGDDSVRIVQESPLPQVSTGVEAGAGEAQAVQED